MIVLKLPKMSGNSLAVQWLGLNAFIGPGLDPDQEIKILHATIPAKKIFFFLTYLKYQIATGLRKNKISKYWSFTL